MIALACEMLSGGSVNGEATCPPTIATDGNLPSAGGELVVIFVLALATFAAGGLLWLSSEVRR